MDLNFSVFQEPRGVMRILHLVFSISAFAAISGFTGSVAIKCSTENGIDYTYDYDYPFQLNLERNMTAVINETDCQRKVSIIGDFSSDARFFVATGVLAMLCALALIFLYIKYDNTYKTNNQVPLIDFVLTVIFAVLWLSSSAAWANGLSGLKHVTDPNFIIWTVAGESCKQCPVDASGFSTLNISVVGAGQSIHDAANISSMVTRDIFRAVVRTLKMSNITMDKTSAAPLVMMWCQPGSQVLGFLNFFLWAADLWFVYKETAWFQGNQGVSTSGV